MVPIINGDNIMNFDRIFITHAYCFASVCDLQAFHNAIECAVDNDARENGPKRDDVITAEEAKLIMEGKPVDAIKAIRARTGQGLKDAKVQCDRFRSIMGKMPPHPVVR